MQTLKVKSKYNLPKYGDVYMVSLRENGFNGLRKEFNELKGRKVEINSKMYTVMGIEAFATGESYIHESIGLLVREA